MGLGLRVYRIEGLGCKGWECRARSGYTCCLGCAYIPVVYVGISGPSYRSTSYFCLAARMF